MASINRYYSNDKAAMVYYGVYIAVDNHFSDLLFDGDNTRIVTARDDYALRKRSDQLVNKGRSDLDFPFMNYKNRGWSFNDAWRKHTFPGYYQGIFIDELGQKVKYDPVSFEFEGTFWFQREDDMAYAFQQLRFDLDGQTQLQWEVVIDGVTIPGYIEFEYTALDYDPDYTETDWLVQNKIHTIRFNFNAHTFDILPESPEDGNYSLTEEVILDFSVRNTQDVATFEKHLEFVYDKFNETITPKV